MLGSAADKRDGLVEQLRSLRLPGLLRSATTLRIPETVGRRTVYVKPVNWYLSRLHKAAHTDPVAALAFHRVGNPLAPPPSLMHPPIVVRVLCGNLRPSRTPSPNRPCSFWWQPRLTVEPQKCGKRGKQGAQMSAATPSTHGVMEEDGSWLLEESSSIMTRLTLH